MTNHFHILVEIPPKHARPDFSDDEKFLRHCSNIYSSLKLRELRWQLAEFSKVKNLEAVERVLAEEGRLSESQMLRCRVRYFVDGGE